MVVKHGLLNAMIPLVTMMGLKFGFLLCGSIVVEKVVFNCPGLCRLLVDAVEMLDCPVIQAKVLLFLLEFILINLLVDMLYAAVNSTIRYQLGGNMIKHWRRNAALKAMPILEPNALRTPWQEFWWRF